MTAAGRRSLPRPGTRTDVYAPDAADSDRVEHSTPPASGAAEPPLRQDAEQNARTDPDHPDEAEDDLDERTVAADTYQADFLGAHLGPDGDPFSSTLLITADNGAIQVWAPLSPTTITALTDKLNSILWAQKAALGVPPDNPGPADHVGDANPDHGDEVEQRSFRDRLSDPMGLRGLRTRSSATPIVITCAIAALLILAFVGKFFLA